ncbi:MAG: hypothetical protein JXR65_05295 [Bacteroidales bacterium]|nr:hypothetical protein [Bacteroidales bacterium]
MKYGFLIFWGLFLGFKSLLSIPVSDSIPVGNDTGVHTMIFYKPKVQAILPKEVDETSGLIFWDNSLWTLNDSGNKPVLYRLDSITGKVIQRIQIKGAVNHDWEALTQDKDHIYIGDVGDNFGKRKSLTIYILKKSLIPHQGDVALPAREIHFTYPDKRPEKVKRLQNDFDCESLVSIDDSLYLFSKDWGNQHTRCYRLPKTPGTYTAQHLFDFNSNGLITAATFEKKDNMLVLLGYTKGDWIPFIWLFYDFRGHEFFAGKRIRIDMPQIIATQTEAITFTHGLNGYISSEGNKLFYQSLDRIDLQPIYQRNLKRDQKVLNRKLKLEIHQVKDKDNVWELSMSDVLPVNDVHLTIVGSNGKPVKGYTTQVIRDRKQIKILLLLQNLKSGEYILQVKMNGVQQDLPLNVKGKE